MDYTIMNMSQIRLKLNMIYYEIFDEFVLLDLCHEYSLFCG